MTHVLSCRPVFFYPDAGLHLISPSSTTYLVKNYTIEHIKEAFRAASTGLTEAAFLAYLEVKDLLVHGAPAAKRGRKPRGAAKVKVAKVRKSRRAKRGSLGAGILKFLSAKGKAGAHVKDIAAAIGSKAPNVTAWFYSTGKKNKDVKALGGNTFSYVPKQ